MESSSDLNCNFSTLLNNFKMNYTFRLIYSLTPEDEVFLVTDLSHERVSLESLLLPSATGLSFSPRLHLAIIIDPRKFDSLLRIVHHKHLVGLIVRLRS